MEHTMHAVQLMGFGDLDQLHYGIVPRPDPASGEVLVRVGACGLNNTDLNLRKGWYGSGDESGWKDNSEQFPIIQGADIVGEIVAVGDGVRAERIGQRVMVNPTIYHNDPENPHEIDFTGSERNGGFADYVTVPAENAYLVNVSLTDAELATFATAYLTAEHMLQRANVASGETVLVTGASGGVGSALVQLVQARGAQAIAVVGTGKEDFARDLGAVHVISRHAEAYPAALPDYDMDVVADVVGGGHFSKFMEMVKVGGRIVTCGAIAGAVVEIDLRTLYLRHLTLIGSTLGTASEFASLVGYIESGKIKPLLAATFPLEQMAQAQTMFESKAYTGKIVMTP